MGVLGGNSGLFAWCASGTAAIATHILLLWAVAPAPRVETTSAATSIQWEAVEIATAPAAAEHAEAAAPPAVAKTSSIAAAPRRARASEPVAASLTLAARTAAVSGKAPAPKSNATASASSDVSSAAGAAGSEASSAAAPRLAAAVGDGAASAGSASAAVSGQSASGGRTGSLLRGPRLLTTRDPCVGYFPRTAAADRGQVQLSVDVDARGDAHPSQTLSELPRGQGFEHAAKACAAHLHFAPALNAEGQPVAAQARIALKFDRS